MAKRKEFWALSEERTEELLLKLCDWAESEGLSPEQTAIFCMVAYKILFDQLGIFIESFTKLGSQKIQN